MASESAEVAEDYRLALEDLSGNLRHEISNLTVIARENTEHALAIAEVLQQHILKAPPNKKLPALYVLDSIVKNVGTPYTLYFGRNLFKTFMESYAVVDHVIRRKMEEMLKTWKDPVAGSLDTRPPFSPELVRPIENALMKVRATTMQQGALPGRPRSAMMPHRNTPTPPGMRGPGGPPGGYPTQPYPPHNGARPGEPMPGHAPYPGQPQQPQQHPYYGSQSTTPQPVSSAPPFQPPVSGPHGSAGIAAPAGTSVEKLGNDIQNLIVAMKAEFSQNPHDTSVQTRLKALLDLQGVVQSAGLPPDQLELIKNRVNELAAVTMRAPSAQNPTPFAPPVPQPQPQPQSQARPPSVTQTAGISAPPQVPVTLDSLLGQGALAALVQRQSATPQNSTPNPPPYTNVAIRSPPPPTHAEPPRAAGTSAQNPMSLMDQLRQAGMLPPAAAPAGSSAPAPPPAPVLPPNLSDILANARAAGAQAGIASSSDPGLDSAALKQQFRPEAVAALYDDLGPPCTQCGRRFTTDEQGKQKKMAHMDWHFRVHQRSTEAEKRGTHRSWYVDQQDWLKSREVVDADHIAVAEEAAAAEAFKAAEAAKPKYIPVPDASRGVNTVCPICQERFENKWLDTAQEWVWLDAVLVGGARAYHASCHAEATRDREGTPGGGGGSSSARRTPDAVLGKRKAEAGISSPKVRSLKTSA